MKKNILIISILTIGIAFAGCSNNKGVDNKANGREDVKTLATSQSNSKEDNYETVGEIIDFDNEGVHVLTGDIAEIFKVHSENIKEFYLGETVAVEKVGENQFKLVKYEVKDFEQRYTNMGEMISKVSGKVKKADNKTVTIETKDGDLEFELYEGMFVESGTDVIVEYIDREDGKILIDIYNENFKIDMKIKSIRRLKDGIMIVEAEGKNGGQFEVYFLGRTVLNFNHFDLKRGDEITVYPEVIRESDPAQVDAKMVNRK